VFTGFRSDIPELLCEAAVSVLPSLSEGLSNTLLESMAAGVPAVATSVGGNPEVIEHEVSGLLVPARDAAALAAAMGRLLGDKDFASRLGQAGRRRVAELFSVEQSVRDTEHLYRRLIGANSSV
jgi:glycosyltransferase involved in cell wall biosynthesis